MSSTTAAPRIVRAEPRAERRRGSASTAEVMPTLVADSAAPRKIARLGALVEDQAEHEAGGERKHDVRATPTRAAVRADLAHLREPRLEADPEEQEDDAELGEDLEHLARLDEAEHRRADRASPARISPTSAGWWIRLKISSPILAASRMIARSVSAAVASVAAASGI